MASWGPRNIADCGDKKAFDSWAQAENAAHYSQQIAGRPDLVFRPYRGKCCGRYHVGASQLHANDNARHNGKRRPHEGVEIDTHELRRIRRLSDALDVESTS
jgi:hypothetical protein